LTKTCGNLGRFSRFCSRIRILGQPPIQRVNTMARSVRVEYPGAYCRVINRGDLCKTPPFAQFLRQAQILILKILNVFLRLKSSPSLTLNKIRHFSKVSRGNLCKIFPFASRRRRDVRLRSCTKLSISAILAILKVLPLVAESFSLNTSWLYSLMYRALETTVSKGGYNDGKVL
jgi:hypothetical protein